MGIVVGMLGLCCTTIHALQVCDQAHAFAGDPGSAFELLIPGGASGGGDALVLQIHAPRPPLDPVPPAALNVTYTSSSGRNSAISDANGIVMLHEFEPANMYVVVQKSAAEPVPFTFFSYIANFPLCFVQFDANNDFIGKLPAKVPPSNVAANFYLSTRVPAAVNTFTVKVAGASKVFYSNQRNIVPTNAVEIQNGEGTFSWQTATDGPVVYFLIVPQQEFTGPIPTVRASITWEAREAGPPLPMLPHPGGLAPNGGVQNPELPPVAGPSSPTPAIPRAEQIAEDAGIGFGSFLLFCIVTFTIYLMGRSVYNYRINGITTYPDFVPHHEKFAEIRNFVSALTTNILRRRGPGSGLSRGGYEDVGREELEG